MNPISLKTYPVPKAHKENFEKELEHSVIMGVLERSNNPEWGATSFAQPKLKTNWVSFLSEFRNLNKQSKSKLYQMNNINKIILELEGF